MLLIVGLGVMAAEVWLATTAPPELLGVPISLFVMTAVTEYVVFTEWWEEVRCASRLRRARRP
ncbi:hypothetical protein [Nonomuraea sp. NPDC003804]|uniref:hypothetical protein n=1 Tax=Nonomuraea sp. NPDC003804 TaxID=3154547 RepID=UPI0033A0E307